MAITDNINDDDCYTSAELADELNIGVPRLRQVLAEAKDSGKVPYLVKKKGSSILYTPQYVETLKAWRASLGIDDSGPKTQKGLSSKTAIITIPVMIHDREIADLLKHEFKSESEMRVFLQDKLIERVKPKLNKLKALEEEFEKAKQRLLFEKEA